ncbi:hypothetical protein F5B17DRAFT_21848 [Nemania serpens]|nr:hypothetical protein F5B17DRAFT_21848 [Nemania serpens]
MSTGLVSILAYAFASWRSRSELLDFIVDDARHSRSILIPVLCSPCILYMRLEAAPKTLHHVCLGPANATTEEFFRSYYLHRLHPLRLGALAAPPSFDDIGRCKQCKASNVC